MGRLNKNTVEEMLRTKRLQLSRRQLITHYWVVILFGFVFLLPFLMEAWEAIFADASGRGSPWRIGWGSLVFGPISIFFFFWQRRALRFREFRGTFPEEAFQRAVQRTAAQLGWVIDHNGPSAFRAHRTMFFVSRRHGEMITILRPDNGLLMNSICDPDLWSAVTAYGWNRRNVNVFIANLNKACNGGSSMTDDPVI